MYLLLNGEQDSGLQTVMLDKCIVQAVRERFL